MKVVRSDRMPWATQLLTSEPAAVIEGLREADPELCPLGPAAQEALRIEAGVPRAGAEFTGAEFPQEARLESAVSFDKGCYLGQETVARIHYRGHVNRLLTRLALDGDVACPAELEVDGRRVGRVTSSTQLGGHAALGYVRREQAEAGQQLQVVGWPGVTATVLPVPTD